MPKPDIVLRSKKKKANALVQQQRLAEARELYRQLCRLERSDPQNWFTLGLLNGMLGDLEEAAACNREATALRPDYADAHFNRAKALQGLGRHDEAEQSYRRALELKRSWPEAFNNLGNVLQELGRLREAIESYRQALALKPAYVDACLNLGNALRRRGEFMEAVGQYHAVLRAQPGHAAAYKALGSAQIALGRLDEALASYRRGAELEPDAGSVAAQAGVLERLGRPEEAYALIRPFLDGGRVEIEIANVLATLCDGVGRCQEAIALLERGLSELPAAVPRERRSGAHFSLGRLYDRAGQYEKAFSHFKAANDLQADGFDRGEFVRFIDALIETFDAGFLECGPRARHSSSRPLFIVGMPRSGTSLVEQIVASHPDVYGGGELEDIKRIAFGAGALLGASKPYPQLVRELTPEGCDLLAARYLGTLDALCRETCYVTDKMPQNFLALGLIAVLFPEARVIHCVRDPIDTCLSCYSHDFTGYHPYAHRLENLGFYYRQYQRLMRHWQIVLPIPMLSVVYEDLVADQEAGTRQLLAFCDLPWDDRCLRFYESGRIVHTSSYQQVRKPIYRSSLARRRHYAAHLEPLRRALDDSEDRRG